MMSAPGSPVLMVLAGAIPIRRNTKDPAYLITLKAYVSELLHKHDLFYYPEGGRSYSGELKPAKTRLTHIDDGFGFLGHDPCAGEVRVVGESMSTLREAERGRLRSALGPKLLEIPAPVVELRRRLAELPADREIVAYCRGPYCAFAHEAVAILRGSRSARRVSGSARAGWRTCTAPRTRTSAGRSR